MKKVFLLVSVFVLSLLTLSGGVVMTVHAAGVTTETIDDTRYNYLSDPRMMAADNSTIYLVNGNELIFINKSDGQTINATSPITLGFEPKHISLANNVLFVFTNGVNGVHYASTSPLPSTLSNNLAIDTSDWTAFHATYNNVTHTYRIYFATNYTYGCYDFGAGMGNKSGPHHLGALTDIDSYYGNYVINSIAATDENNIYLGAGIPTSPYERWIFKHGEALTFSNQYFNSLTSLNLLGDKLVFIAGQAQQLYTMNMDKTFTRVTLNDENLPTMHRSRQPVFITTTSSGEIYVIDSSKQSIDQYTITDGALAFDKTICAHFGDDEGFYTNPRAICVIGAHRYVVSDGAGVKLIDMNKSGKQQVINFPALPTFVTKITYDSWRNVYLYTSDAIYKYEISEQNSIKFINTVNATEADQFDLSDLRAANPTALDVVVDALNIPIYLIKETNEYYLEWEYDSVPQKVHLAGAAPMFPYSLTLDRLNGKIYWIAEHHAIESFEIPDYWSPKGKEHYDWQSATMLANDDETKNKLFMKVAEGAVLYEYPNAVSPKIKIAETQFVHVLKYEPTLGDRSGFAYAYVMYKNQPYYVAHEKLQQDAGFSTIQLDDFNPSNDPYNQASEYVGYSGRVLVHNLPIYKYPMLSNSPNLIIGYINRNHGLSGGLSYPGLKINRMILVKDSTNCIYYEILLNDDGTPPKDGDMENCHYVGYVDSGYVIDSYQGPSSEKFSTNARVLTSRSMTEGVQVYSSATATPETAYENELLQNGDRIRVIDKIDRSKPYTAIMYYDGYGEKELSGFIKTEYIQMDGITTWQIIAIIALIASVSVGIYFIIRHIKLNRKSPPPL